MIDGPLVSIVTAAIAERTRTTLAATIRSVDAQTYRPLEHWVIFDGFSGLRRCEPPPGADLRRGVERHVLELGRNWHGITGSSWGLEANAVGLYLARGEFACFLADDDALATDHVESLMAAIQDRDYAMCQYKYARGGILGDGNVQNACGDGMILFRIADYSREPHRCGTHEMDREWLRRFCAGKRGAFVENPSYLVRPHEPEYQKLVLGG